MVNEHFLRFFPVICAGFGLFLVGAVNLLLVKRGLVVRALASVAALGIALAAAAALDQPGATAGTARLLAYGLVPVLALGSRSVATGIATTFAAAHRPAVRFGLLAAAGIVTAIGAIAVYERADEAASQASLDELELIFGRPQTVPNEQVKVATDRGTRLVPKEPVSAREETELTPAEERFLRSAHLDDQVIRRSAANDWTNCHGWVFTGGRFLLSGEDVELILKENGYHEQTDPRPGDLVVYHDMNGTNAITHTAVVRYVAEGQPVMVESKWGNLGVFLHPADKSPYGTTYVFHRSTRRGDLLAGFGGPASPTGEAQPVPVAVE